MDDRTLIAAFALGGAAPHVARIGPFSLVEGDPGALVTRPATGADAPGPGALRLSAGGGMEWWAAPGTEFAALPDMPFGAGVVDQSDGWLWFEITAPDGALAALFARLCDVDLPALAAPWSARSVIEHHGVWLLCPQAGRIVLLGPRSTARSLARAVEDAARSVVAQGLV